MAGLSRMELWSRLGRIQTAEIMFGQAYAAIADYQWRNRLTDTDYRGDHWWTSLRGSMFPADDDRYCARKALYALMGMPEDKPSSRMLTGTAVVGTAAEAWNVVNLEFDGRLLAASESAVRERRVGFVDADYWLTGSPDFVVLPPFWNRPLLIETKTKDKDVVIEMRNGLRSYDAQHMRQLDCYIGLGNRVSPLVWPDAVVCRHTWRIAEPGVENVIDAMVCQDHGIHADSGCLIKIELEPLRSGVLKYMGRDRIGNVTIDYFREHDERRFRAGLDKLLDVRRAFLNDELPPHPFKGKEWSKPPCQYCPFKAKACRPDHAKDVVRLSETRGAEFAQSVYGHYDPAWAREQVLDRWRDRSGIEYRLPPERNEQKERV